MTEPIFSVTPEPPTYNIVDTTVTYENPKIIFDGIVMHREACIEIDTANMRSDFLKLLMYHMGEGHIRIKVAKRLT